MFDRIVVLDGHALNPGDLSWSGFEEFGEVTVHARTGPASVVERARGARFLLTNKVPLGAEELAALPELAYVGVLATGYNVVDVAAAGERGVAVTNVPAYGTDSVAQHALSLLLELARQPARHAAAVREGAWTNSQDWCFALAPVVELSGMTLGIIGFGRIGGAFARICGAMGMRIIAHGGRREGRWQIEGHEVEFTGLDELFVRADVVSLHCPLKPETERLVDAARLATMKPTAYLLNTSRGPLVDSVALARALDSGIIAGAGLDVLDEEPPPANHPLLRAPNCLITPHIGWYARAARQRLMNAAVENMRAFVLGSPINTVGT